MEDFIIRETNKETPFDKSRVFEDGVKTYCEAFGEVYRVDWRPLQPNLLTVFFLPDNGSYWQKEYGVVYNLDGENINASLTSFGAELSQDSMTLKMKETTKSRLPLICTLDGYKYYLGDRLEQDVNWSEAVKYTESLGEGWELPSREVAIVMMKKYMVDRCGTENLWLGCEVNCTEAWVQGTLYGEQFYDCKSKTEYFKAHPVLKVKE